MRIAEYSKRLVRSGEIILEDANQERLCHKNGRLLIGKQDIILKPENRAFKPCEVTGRPIFELYGELLPMWCIGLHNTKFI